MAPNELTFFVLFQGFAWVTGYLLLRMTGPFEPTGRPTDEYEARERARRAPRSDERQVERREAQAELFARELPPKPGAVTTIARLACDDCGELTDVDALAEVDGRRVCDGCSAAANGGAGYR